MEQLKAKLRTISERISKFITNARKTSAEKRNEEFLKARLLLLDKYWDQFNTAYENVFDNAPEEKDKGDELFDTDMFSDVECAYVEAITWLQDQLKSFKATRNGPDEASFLDSTTQFPQQGQLVKLPKINLPSFSGTFLDWSSFHDTYVSLIHHNHSLADVQKMHYLKSAITGDAAKLLKHFAITSANYESAWNIIVTRYENKRVLVDANIHELVSVPAMLSESPAELRRVLDRFNQAVRALDNLSRPVKEWDDWLIYFLARKLDSITRKDWETSLQSSKEAPSFLSLQGFLETRLQALSTLGENSNPQKFYPSRKSHSRSYSHHASSTTQCSVCQGAHFILFCPEFRSKSIDERVSLLAHKRLCFNCLRANHRVESCPSSKRCQKCGQKHHTMIHRSSDAPGASESSTDNHLHSNPLSVYREKASTTSHNTRSHVANNQQGSSSILLATAMVFVESTDGRLVKARALLDQGSESSFITEELANILRLRRQRINISVLGIGQCNAGKVESAVSHRVVSCIDTSEKYCVQSFVLPKLTHLIPSKNIHGDLWPHIIGLPLADPNFDKASGVDLILGAEIYSQILKEGIRCGRPGTPTAQNTSLGWILSGKIQNVASHVEATISLHSSAVNLDTLLRKFWEMEEPPKAQRYTPEEMECEAFFADTHYRTEEGRYVVKLPFKSNQPPLGRSRGAAMNALLRLEKRFAREPTLLQPYADFIKEYISLNHMELVPNETEDLGRCYYLPHHPVLKPTSTTTKLRVVFNASQGTTAGQSLNDNLYIGPKLQNDIFLVLTRWRFYPYVYNADIEKMFRQILVDRNDVDFQRILWRESSQQAVRCYRLLTVTYGTACAPYLACKALQQLAKDYETQFPAASRVLVDNFYVDDALFGSYSIESLRTLRLELDTLLSQGGFKLRKWLANSAHLLKEIPAEDRELSTSLKIVSDSQIKTLGVGWNPASDSFNFHISLSNSTVSTKRSVLAAISRLYDPCGWLSPVTITAKVFLQSLWKHQMDWDAELPYNLQAKWQTYKQDLKHINALQIPRWVSTKDSNPAIELHGFCDASQLAYGAAVYVRILQDNKDIDVHLLAAKTRVSPIRAVSLPRLELCGAALLAELLPYLQSNLNLQDVPVHTWTDSTIVLAWLRAHSSKWNVYVANRVALIHERLPNACWHHISSEDNPADCITRGISPSALQDFKLWWQGPPWLRLSLENWPLNKASNDEEVTEEVVLVHSSSANTTTLASTEDFISTLLHRFSDLMRLLRITAYCFRFFTACKLRSSPHRTNVLTTSEIGLACEAWIKLTQQEAFSTEMRHLVKDKRAILPTTSKLRMLNPKIDDKGLLRVGGRLKHALLSEDERHPFILPSESYFTHLVIAHSHGKTLHGGAQATLQHIRNKYWIINGRNKVRQFIRRCIIYCRFRGAVRTPLMGDLPMDRVRPAKPFLHTGVDFAGPFNVKVTRGRGRAKFKTYVSSFICLATRAIHLELVMDLTAEAFIAAFRRFISRRGRCARMYSDNGRNFIAADKQLRQHLRQLINQSTIPHVTIKDGTEWHFIPPYSPHMGGLWEASIKAMKHHLRRVVGNQILTVEEMLTLLTQVEACLNSRPLQALTDDPMDMNALTPGHFLVGESILALPEASILDVSTNRLGRWQMVQHMFEAPWRRWYKEYLSNLQLRKKWQHPTEPIRLNSLVLIKEDNLPPLRWLLGRVVALHPGADEEVRVVTVRHKDGYFKRPVTKLCILPVDPPQSESQPPTNESDTSTFHGGRPR